MYVLKLFCVAAKRRVNLMFEYKSKVTLHHFCFFFSKRFALRYFKVSLEPIAEVS